uniref:Uncharacterized protein n=1 Tax=viral metagenome TaxID=1070528 RepID=A0A6C0H5X5_9ZZZZ
MSKNASSYSKYLNDKKCCNYLSQVSCIGQTGPTGVAGYGIQGDTGPTGESITGPTGPSSSITGPTGSKSFIIDHPIYPKTKYLVHMCLEGPEAGVFYRGESKIGDGNKTEIELPNYVSHFSSNFSVFVSAKNNFNLFSVSLVDESGKFTVYSNGIGEFYWIVYGTRKNCEFEVEPNKKDIILRGDGPYLYYDKKN